MKLLFVHEYLGALGGAENDILLTAKELQARGHVVALLYSRATGRNEEAWNKSFGRTFQINPGSPKESIWTTLRDFAPDAIYLHSLDDLGCLEILVDSDVPVVRRVHDHSMYCMRGYKYNYLTRAVCRRPAGLGCIFPCGAFLGRNRRGPLPVKWVSFRAKLREIALNRRCNRFIVYSQYQKEELVRNGFDGARIHTHVPVHCWGTTGALSNFSERNLLLFAGQIIRGKGVDLLLKALAKVTARFECMIFGEGSHRKVCERLSERLGLSDRVKFCGFVPSDALREYFLQATALVISSVWPEPFALVGQEAMRYGLPVVAFDAGGIREWLLDKENGFLVPWMDTARMAARIDQVLNDKALARRLGLRGLKLVNERYEAKQQVIEVEKIFLDVLRESTSWDGGHLSPSHSTRLSEPIVPPIPAPELRPALASQVAVPKFGEYEPVPTPLTAPSQEYL